MDQPNLTVNGINVQQQQAPDGKGGFVLKKHVTFYVGDHGPFYLDYTGTDGTADRIKSDIQAQVTELQSISQLGS